jgi:hypothetical protein
MGLKGKTPAKKAGINLKLERNKLLTLIELFHNSEWYLWFKNIENFNSNFYLQSL